MARWRSREPPRVEGPAWYRTFDPEAWDTPDAQELSMISGSLGFGPWPEELHRIHAERRWGQAKHAYRQAHPALAEQELEDLIAEAHERRRDEESRY